MQALEAEMDELRTKLDERSAMYEQAKARADALQAIIHDHETFHHDQGRLDELRQQLSERQASFDKKVRLARGE